MEKQSTEGQNRITRPPSTALVVFGASGDLTQRKLIPALYNLAHDDYLPSSFVILGVSRSKMTHEDFRGRLLEGLRKYSRQTVDESVWEVFSKNIFYLSLDASRQEDFQTLKAKLEEFQKERNEHFNYLFYMAVSPANFANIAANLKSVGLVEDPKNAARTTAVIIEKPFGHDLTSAKVLNSLLRQSLEEKQIFRIDHYLGKETVQNILIFRFANGIFEPLWNHNHVDHIQISGCEEIGVGNRAPYFDASGILRDMVQNHLLQILSLLCIEPPISLNDANSIRDEKVKVLRSIRRMKIEEVGTHTVRAQYTKGFVNGETVPGYLEEAQIPPQSQTETFVALKLEIDNWRWSGVPIYVRSGKRLPKRTTEITVFFKKAPNAMFRGRQVGELEHNVLSIQVQPHEGISLKVNSKPPGPRLKVKPVDMDFSYGHSFEEDLPEAYERLLLDAMKGNSTLFIRDDEIEEAWDLLNPILEAWESNEPPPLFYYEAGTWGPREADIFLGQFGHKWKKL